MAETLGPLGASVADRHAAHAAADPHSDFRVLQGADQLASSLGSAAWQENGRNSSAGTAGGSSSSLSSSSFSSSSFSSISSQLRKWEDPDHQTVLGVNKYFQHKVSTACIQHQLTEEIT